MTFFLLVNFQFEWLLAVLNQSRKSHHERSHYKAVAKNVIVPMMQNFKVTWCKL